MTSGDDNLPDDADGNYIELISREPSTARRDDPLSPFPLDRFPRWAADYARNLVTALQVPEDLIGLAMLGVQSATAGRNVKVTAWDGWVQPLCLWVAGIAAPGSRKSAVIAKTVAPLRVFEKELIASAAERNAELQVQLRAAKAASEAVNKELAAANSTLTDDDDAEERKAAAKERATKAELDLQRASDLQIRDAKLVLGDATAEAVADALSDNGAIVIVDDEATIWSHALGRYTSSGAAPIEIYLSAYSGEPVTITRRGQQKTRQIESPALSMIVMAQPTMLNLMTSNLELGGRGFADRWIIAAPRNNLGERDHYASVEASKQSSVLGRAYTEGTLAILRTCRAAEPTNLQFDEASRERLLAWMQELEPQLRTGGQLEKVATLFSKRSGELARIAAILHLMHAVRGDTLAASWTSDIPVERVNDAEEIVRWSLELSLRMSKEAHADPTTRLAGRILNWLRAREPLHSESSRNILTAMRNRNVKAMADLQPAINQLVEEGWMSRVLPKAGQKGRAVHAYWVHPQLWNS